MKLENAISLAALGGNRAVETALMTHCMERFEELVYALEYVYSLQGADNEADDEISSAHRDHARERIHWLEAEDGPPDIGYMLAKAREAEIT